MDDGVIAPQQEDIDDASRCGHGDISWIGLSWIHFVGLSLSKVEWVGCCDHGLCLFFFVFSFRDSLGPCRLASCSMLLVRKLFEHVSSCEALEGMSRGAAGLTELEVFFQAPISSILWCA